MLGVEIPSKCLLVICSNTRDRRRFLRKVYRSSVWALRIKQYLVDFNLWSLVETYCLYILCVINSVRHEISLEISWHPFLMSSVIMWGHNVVVRLVYWYDRLIGLSLGRESHREDSCIFTLPLNRWCNGTINGMCVMVSMCLPSHNGLSVTFK